MFPDVSEEMLFDVDPNDSFVSYGSKTVEPFVGVNERFPEVVETVISPPEIVLTLLRTPPPRSMLVNAPLPNWTSPYAPENTSLTFVPSLIKTNLPRLFLYPKNPTLEPAVPAPEFHLNSIPRSLASFSTGPTTPPKETIGSCIFVTVL